MLVALLSCSAPADTNPGEAPHDTSVTVTDDGSDFPVAVELTGCSYYRTVPVKIGAQTFDLIVDSGSATLAVSAEGCDSCESAGVLELYDTDHGEDRGFETSGYYDDGSIGWEGNVYEDEVEIEGLPPAPIRFVAVSAQTSIFGSYGCEMDEEVPVEGILGLAPDAALHRRTDSYLSEVVENGVPDAFAIRTCHSGGTLWVGGYDPSSTVDEMSYVPLLDERLYWVEVASIGLQDDQGLATIQVTEDGDARPALVDSGGPHLIVPEFAYDQVRDTLSADPDFAVLGDAWWDREWVESTVSPTMLDEMLPQFIVDLGSEGLQLSLPPTESYIKWYDLGDGTWLYQRSILNGAEYGWDTYVDLGNLPMYRYVVLTDRAQGRLGFAPAVDCD